MGSCDIYMCEKGLSLIQQPRQIHLHGSSFMIYKLFPMEFISNWHFKTIIPSFPKQNNHYLCFVVKQNSASWMRLLIVDESASLEGCKARDEIGIRDT